MIKVGERLFNNLDSNEYLHELFRKISCDYSIKIDLYQIKSSNVTVFFFYISLFTYFQNMCHILHLLKSN